MTPDLPPSELPPDLPAPPDLLRVLLDTSLSGVMLMRPVYDAAGTTVVDLTVVYLNATAQHMLRLPARPDQSLLTLYPTAEAVGVFAFYRDAFLSGKLERRQNNYQHDGLDGYFVLVAQRLGDVLVVNFDDTNGQPRTAAEQDLRASQTREQKAHAAVERERNMLQAILTQAPAAFALFQGPELRIAAANAAICTMWERAPEQVLGKPLLEALPELRGQGFDALLHQVRDTRVPVEGRETPALLLRDGHMQTTYYNFVYQPLFGPRGELIGVVDIAVEVTEQVLARQRVQELNDELAAANEELRTSNEELLAANAALIHSQLALSELNEELEARVQERTRAVEQQQGLLRQILRQVPASIATLAGPEHRYTFFNEPYLELTGHRAYEGLSVADVLPELDAQGFVGLLDQVYATGQPFVAREKPVGLLDPATGRPATRYLDLVYQPLRNEDGHTTGILAFLLETTDRVLARQATEATAQRLRLLTDALPVLIAYIDREQRYRFVNHAYRTWFNRDPEALLGQPARAVLGEAAYAAAQPYIDRALAGERLSFEARMPYREGFVRHTRTDYIPDVQHGEVVGFYSLVTDVSEQTAAREQVQELNEELAAINEEMLVANEELRDTNDRLSHANVDLDTFVYTASHDLRAPIANIEGLLLALEEQLPAPVRQDADVTHLLELMRDSVARFQRTLMHLTDVSKLQLAHAEPAEAVDLAALAEAVRQDLEPALAATGARLSVDVSACPTLRFSPKNLRSILYNLLSNAVKYHRPGHPPVVTLRASCPKGQVWLEVADNGLGLSDEEQAKLFVMFRRLHTHVPGTGVGLYMVKRMAENAGGTVRVHSQLGWGSTFTVVLPDLT
ncbi:PAS domain-containing protein [Hymenobacter sp. 5317J-9]|uniref:PAS domain-containing protein n=1 Tax=Hymenobacter sp. 5317J-9 TaxID=2932250 RepID=UPI001FD6672C|nr:PAS domain-containing protein [Hymenobacter sp. 5317J-9]UOQ97277.1 PAS domain-containing protein [Hymenobacter sp. 5317J-9]